MQETIRIPKCLDLLLAMEEDTDCKKTTCKHHLLANELGLDPGKINKTEKYYDCYGCGAFLDEEWEMPEIAELWGWDKQLVNYYEKKALTKLRKEGGLT